MLFLDWREFRNTRRCDHGECYGMSRPIASSVDSCLVPLNHNSLTLFLYFSFSPILRPTTTSKKGKKEINHHSEVLSISSNYTLAIHTAGHMNFLILILFVQSIEFLRFESISMPYSNFGMNSKQQSSSKGQRKAGAGPAKEFLDRSSLESLALGDVFISHWRCQSFRAAFKLVNLGIVGGKFLGAFQSFQSEVPYVVLELERVPPELVDDVFVFLVFIDDLIVPDNTVTGHGSTPSVSSAAGNPIVSVALGRGDSEPAARGGLRGLEAAGARGRSEVTIRVGFLQLGDGIGHFWVAILVAVVGFVVGVRGLIVVVAFDVLLEDEDLPEAFHHFEIAVIVDDLPKEILLFGCGLLLDLEELHELFHRDPVHPVGNPEIVAMLPRVVLDMRPEVYWTEFHDESFKKFGTLTLYV